MNHLAEPHDVDFVCGGRQRPPVVCIEFPDSSGVLTLIPLTDDSGVNSSRGVSKAGERCCCASSGVCQRSRTAEVGWLAEGESQPSTQVREIFAGHQRHRIQSVTWPPRRDDDDPQVHQEEEAAAALTAQSSDR